MTNDFCPQSSLLNILQEISRSPDSGPQALARKTGSPLSTVKDPITQLCRRQLIVPAKGRRGISLNRDYGRLVGIDMGASHLHFALADFSGEILSDAVERVRPEDGPRKTIRQIRNGIQRLLATEKQKKLRAIALAAPSAVDPRTGLVLMANNLPGWKNVDLKHELEQAFSLPVCIENDANMAAIGEHWRGAAREVSNFIFLALGTGIGSGIFINNQLHVGRTGSAGELQFLNLEWQRWNEDFGETGYFESYASGQGIANLGRKLMKGRTAGTSLGLAETRDAYFVFEAFHKGNAKARKTLETTFTILGVGIANVVGVLDPDMIVLGGGISRGDPEFMLSTVRRVAQKIQPNCPPILISELGERAQTCGAIHSSQMAACKAAVSRKR